MTIAFLILNHRPPAQLIRLLNTLRAQLPDSPIVVHHDVFGAELSSDLLEPIDNVHLLTSRKPVTWGDFSLVDIYRSSLTWMTKHVVFDWVVMLSAQDYPIKPLSGLAADLTLNDADAVLRATQVDRLTSATARRDMRRRYLYQYYAPNAGRWSFFIPAAVCSFLRKNVGSTIDMINILQPFFKICKFPDRMPYRFGWRARRTPFGSHQPCWYGPMWFALSRRATDYTLNYMSDHPEFVNYYRRTVIPDESMFATIIHNSGELRVSNLDTHYTRWSQPKPAYHPDIFRADDLAELTAAAPFFARKFDIAVDTEILDKLDEFIGVPAGDRG